MSELSENKTEVLVCSTSCKVIHAGRMQYFGCTSFIIRTKWIGALTAKETCQESEDELRSNVGC